MPEKETVKKASVDVGQLWKVAKKFFIGYKIEILSLIVIAAVVVFTSSLASQRVVTEQKAAEQCECRFSCESDETAKGSCEMGADYGFNCCKYVAPPPADCSGCSCIDGQLGGENCSCPGRACSVPACNNCSCIGGQLGGENCDCPGRACSSPTSVPTSRPQETQAPQPTSRPQATGTPLLPAACNGRTGSICGHGDSNNDGLVTVLNCTGQTQKYVCQENQEDLRTKETCDAAGSQTNQWKSYRDLWVENGQTGTCSVSPSACGRAQADINLGNSNAICWENTKNCSDCSQITPTSVPTATPTPVPIACPTLNVTCSADGAVQLAWNKIENTAGYRVLRKPAEGQNHQHLWYVTDKNILAYKDTAVTCNQGYSYLVESFSQAGWVGSWPWPGEKFCTPTPVTCNCPSCARIEVLQTTGRPLTDLNSLPAGEVIAVKVIADGVVNYVEDYGVRILRNGLEVKNENAGRAGLSEWTSSTYTLQSGTYEIYGYLKVKGQWK